MCEQCPLTERVAKSSYSFAGFFPPVA